MRRTSAKTTRAERFGRWLGNGWRSMKQKERAAVGRMTRKGVPGWLAAMTPWAVKLAVLGIAFYLAAWLVILVALAVLVVRLLENNEPDFDGLIKAVEESNPPEELREGPSGFGLYDKDDWRVDMGDPYEEPVSNSV